MTMQFEPVGSLNSVPMIGDTDSLVVMTASGPRRILKSDLVAGLVAQIPAIQEWDGASTEVQSASITLGAYGFRSVMSAANLATITDATIDNTNFNASFATPLSMSVALRQQFRFNGVLPKTGKYWLTINADFTGLSSGASIILYALSDIGTLAQIGPAARTGILISTTVVNPLTETGVTSPGSISTSVSTLKSVLVCFDIDNNQIRYAANGTSYTMQMAASAPLAGRALCGMISAGTTDTSKTIRAIFNNSNTTTSPVTIPGGFVGLQLVNAVLPTYAGQGNGIRSTTSTSYHGQQINAYDLYMVTSDRLALVPDIYKTPQLAAQNVFAKVQLVQSGALFADSWGNYGIQAATDVFYGATAGAGGALVNNMVMGQSVLPVATSAVANVAIGNFALSKATLATSNVALGNAFLSTLSAQSSVAIGSTAGSTLIGALNVVAIGNGALYSAGHLGYNLTGAVAIGAGALGNWVDGVYDGSTLGSASGNGTSSVAIGQGAAQGTSAAGVYMPSAIVAIGPAALANSPGSYNIGIGNSALGSLTSTSSSNIGIGTSAGYLAIGNFNIAMGASALQGSTQGDSVAIGHSALYSSIATVGAGNSSNNVAIGSNAMASYTGNNSTAVGAATMAGGTWNNSTALGYQATVTGDNQVQLGNSSTTTYVYGTVQNRSDIRDKADVRNSLLGMQFLLALRPVDFRWDMREDYIDWSSKPVAPAPLRPEPKMPTGDPTVVGFSDNLVQWKKDHDSWVAESFKSKLDHDVYTAGMLAWQMKNDISKIVHDGSHKRTRFHHGFIAQEVKATADKLGVDFGGYQDHLVKDGRDVKSIGYEEMVGPLVKGFQELYAYINSDEYAEALMERMINIQQKKAAAAQTK